MAIKINLTFLILVCESNSKGTCKIIKGQCWCYKEEEGTPGYEVCGYSAGYSGTYFSIASDSEPSLHTIIRSLGLHPHSIYCPYDTKQGCDKNCRLNQCLYESGKIGCWGVNMETGHGARCHVMHHSHAWKWSDTKSSIVRCTNME